MNKTQSRLTNAAYAFMSLLAILFGVIGVRVIEPFRTLLLHACVDLFCTTLVFFIVERYFLAEESGLAQQIKDLIGDLRASQLPATVTAHFSKKCDYSVLIDSAESIDLAGVTHWSILKENSSTLTRKLANGVCIRIVLIDPISCATEQSGLRSVGRNGSYYENLALGSLRELSNIKNTLDKEIGKERCSERLQVKLLPYPPTCAIANFSMGQTRRRLVVELYGNQIATSPPIITLSEESEKEWMEFYLTQFREMWNLARDVAWESDVR